MLTFKVSDMQELSRLAEPDRRTLWRIFIDWWRKQKFVPMYLVHYQVLSKEEVMFIYPGDGIMLSNGHQLYVMARSKNALTCRTVFYHKTEVLEEYLKFRGDAVLIWSAHKEGERNGHS